MDFRLQQTTKASLLLVHTYEAEAGAMLDPQATHSPLPISEWVMQCHGHIDSQYNSMERAISP